jgi:hypothetical protein
LWYRGAKDRKKEAQKEREGVQEQGDSQAQEADEDEVQGRAKVAKVAAYLVIR